MRNRLTNPANLRNAAWCAVFFFAACASGCWQSSKSARTFTPPPPQAPQAIAQVDHLPDPPLVASVPDLSDGALVPMGVAEAPGPPAPRAAPHRGQAATTTTPPKPNATEATEQAPPQATATPRLGQILPANQAREYNRQLDESLDRVKRAVTALQRKNLTGEQAEALNRIQVFEQQAERARERDLVLAVSIARRADLLAKDLQARVP